MKSDSRYYVLLLWQQLQKCFVDVEQVRISGHLWSFQYRACGHSAPHLKTTIPDRPAVLEAPCKSQNPLLNEPTFFDNSSRRQFVLRLCELSPCSCI